MAIDNELDLQIYEAVLLGELSEEGLNAADEVAPSRTVRRGGVRVASDV